MKKLILKTMILGLFLASFILPPVPAAYAGTPSFSLNSSGDNISFSVYGADPYRQIELAFRNPGVTLDSRTTNVGWVTDSSGYFSGSIPAASNGIYPGATLFAVVNGQTSGSAVYNSSGSGYPPPSGSLSLSQASLTLTAGQSSTVTVYNSYSSIYIANNSNPSVATVSASGNTINIYGNSTGSTTAQICASNYSQCASLFITVNPANSGGDISFNNANIALTVGQTATATIYSSGYNNYYYINSNSNSSVASSSISGNVVSIYAYQAGTTTIRVCGAYVNQCGNIYVTVSGYNGGGNISFSNGNPTLTLGQSQTISIYSNTGAYNNYYISTNTNSSSISASISGSSLMLYAQNIGNSAITVCSYSSSSCATLNAYTTNAGGNPPPSGNNYITFSNASPTVTRNQTNNITVYTQGSYANLYVASNSNSQAVTASLNYNILTLYGQNSGSSTITVCQSSPYYCSSVYVTVSGSVAGTSTYSNGQLIKQNGAVYIVYRGTRTGFKNSLVFLGLGYRFRDVTDTYFTELPDTRYVVSSFRAAHPWGSWISNGSAVYFVHQDGLIPIPSWEIFINNGGHADLIVKSNIYDFRRPQLSVMTYDDSRLK